MAESLSNAGIAEAPVSHAADGTAEPAVRPVSNKAWQSPLSRQHRVRARVRAAGRRLQQQLGPSRGRVPSSGTPTITPIRKVWRKVVVSVVAIASLSSLSGPCRTAAGYRGRAVHDLHEDRRRQGSPDSQ